MKWKAIPWVIVAALPVVGWAVSKEMKGWARLQRVPDLPDQARAAYAQWQVDEGNLKPGSAFQSVETSLINVVGDQTRAVVATPELQQQVPMAHRCSSNSGLPRVRRSCNPCRRLS